jgi:hypothetical protein
MPGANIYTAEMYCAGGLSIIVGKRSKLKKKNLISIRIFTEFKICQLQLLILYFQTDSSFL